LLLRCSHVAFVTLLYVTLLRCCYVYVVAALFTLRLLLLRLFDLLRFTLICVVTFVTLIYAFTHVTFVVTFAFTFTLRYVWLPVDLRCCCDLRCVTAFVRVWLPVYVAIWLRCVVTFGALVTLLLRCCYVTFTLLLIDVALLPLLIAPVVGYVGYGRLFVVVTLRCCCCCYVAPLLPLRLRCYVCCALLLRWLVPRCYPRLLLFTLFVVTVVTLRCYVVVYVVALLRFAFALRLRCCVYGYTHVYVYVTVAYVVC